ncbi:MAG: hypothetical protein MJ185_07900 [Treponema sp.]|nr:hypothetical protein [Treponema sp.]
MKLKQIKKSITVFLLITVSSFSIWAQTQLSNLNTTWSQVIGGKLLSKPVLTPYGFIGATDGKTISSITNNGNVIWEENFGVNSETILSIVSNDFTLAITNSRRKITLFNPSGVPLWNKVLDFEITEKAYEGRDGRFFLRGNEKLCCFSMNGICKWEINTEKQSDIPLQELEDGSLIVFLKNLTEGKTRALRVTPFGSIVEDITFSGEILSASSSSNGIFLTFSDGSAGLFGLSKEGKAINRFVINASDFEKSRLNFFVSNNQKNEAVFVTARRNNAKIIFIDSLSGKNIWEKEIPELNLQNIKEASLTEEGFFICDLKTAYFFNPEGILLWSAKMPEQKGKNKWNYAIFTENNTLVIARENWTMDAYIVEQHAGARKYDKKYDYYLDYLKVDSSVYDTLYLFSLNSEITGLQRYKKLESGFYGEKEITYTSDLLSACEAYISQNNKTVGNTREDLSAFKANPAELESLFTQLPLYGTRYSTNLTAKLLKKEKNGSIIKCIVTGLSKNGYDPDGEILKALETLAGTVSSKNASLQIDICDAVFSICRFMGRPAYNKSGKFILKNFMSPANDSKVRLHARETLEKISALEK